MNHARKALVFMIVLVTPLLLSGVIIPVFQEDAKSVVTKSPVKVSLPSYESIMPLWIYSDFDMENYASALSWEGDGSPSTPYIIEGYSIINNTNCIDIIDVSLAFEIRNCYIDSTSGVSGDGIFIENATQAAIFDTVVVNKSESIKVWDTPEPYIDNCTIIGGTDGISLENCIGATITDSHLLDVFVNGIYISYSNNTMISNNLINGTHIAAGIYLGFSHQATVIDNHVLNCGASGVWVVDSEDVTIENNIIHNNWFFTGGECGIHLDNADFASIVGNEIYDNARNGIFVDDSDGVYIFDNEIYGNSDRGIYLISSINGTILQNNIHENGW